MSFSGISSKCIRKNLNDRRSLMKISLISSKKEKTQITIKVLLKNGKIGRIG